MKRKITLLVCLLTLSAQGANPKQIKLIEQKIHSLQNTLQKDEKSQSATETQIKSLELNIGSLSAKLHRTQERLAAQSLLLSEVKQQRREYESTLEEQKKLLAQQLQVNYSLHRKNPLAFLINQKNPQEMQRLMHYLHSLSEKETVLIEALNRTITQLNLNEQQTQQYTHALANLMETQKKQHAELKQDERQRKKTLALLNRRIQSKNDQLSVLVRDKKALEKVVQHLKGPEQPFNPSLVFDKQRGQLPWPIKGPVIQRFHQPILDSELKTNGILIKAKEGETVHAVSSGEVVFADWMPEFGLLMIINHGNGYLSLYGRNNSLLQSIGDKVQAGEAIALAGNSGGHQQAALYFAIRHQGDPQNPLPWLSPKKA